MNEQIIILIFLVLLLGATLWLYILKAMKQIKYRGDERWQLIQLKANNAANISNGLLAVVLVIIPLLVDSQITFSLNRVITFGLLYIGVRNFIELAATVYYDKNI